MRFEKIELPSNKKFGIFFVVIFIFIAFYFFFINFLFLALSFLGLSALTLLISIIKPIILLPFNKAWMSLSFILGKFISPIVLGFIFFIFITPIAILMYFFGRDELNLKNTKSNTFWKKRVSKELKPSSFRNQF